MVSPPSGDPRGLPFFGTAEGLRLGGAKGEIYVERVFLVLFNFFKIIILGLAKVPLKKKSRLLKQIQVLLKFLFFKAALPMSLPRNMFVSRPLKRIQACPNVGGSHLRCGQK